MMNTRLMNSSLKNDDQKNVMINRTLLLIEHDSRLKFQHDDKSSAVFDKRCPVECPV